MRLLNYFAARELSFFSKMLCVKKINAWLVEGALSSCPVHRTLYSSYIFPSLYKITRPILYVSCYSLRRRLSVADEPLPLSPDAKKNLLFISIFFGCAGTQFTLDELSELQMNICFGSHEGAGCSEFNGSAMWISCGHTTHHHRNAYHLSFP